MRSDRRRSRAVALFHLVGLLLVVSCGDFDRARPAAGSPDVPVVTDGPVTFAAQVHPLLIDRCTACHGGSASNGLALSGDADADLDVVLEHVDADDPASSPLIAEPTGASSHGGGVVLDPVEDASAVALLTRWVEDGAPP